MDFFICFQAFWCIGPFCPRPYARGWHSLDAFSIKLIDYSRYIEQVLRTIRIGRVWGARGCYFAARFHRPSWRATRPWSQSLTLGLEAGPKLVWTFRRIVEWSLNLKGPLRVDSELPSGVRPRTNFREAGALIEGWLLEICIILYPLKPRSKRSTLTYYLTFMWLPGAMIQSPTYNWPLPSDWEPSAWLSSAFSPKDIWCMIFRHHRSDPQGHRPCPLHLGGLWGLATLLFPIVSQEYLPTYIRTLVLL